MYDAELMHVKVLTRSNILEKKTSGHVARERARDEYSGRSEKVRYLDANDVINVFDIADTFVFTSTLVVAKSFVQLLSHPVSRASMPTLQH